MIRFAFVLSFALALSLATAAAARDAHLTFLDINDVYEIEAKNGIGGFGGLAALLKRERARHPGAITVVAGDFLSPSILSSTLKGAQMVALFNQVGVDYVTFGNHEFDFGADVLKQRIGESKFGWLGSNVMGPDGKPF